MNIRALPTLYKGRLYRSRLEARWAAFFDLLGWNAEYEPIDLGSWSPDFALWGRDPRHPIYVEVKPIDWWDKVIARKMADAGNMVADDDCPMLLLGKCPQWDWGELPLIGWIGARFYYEAKWDGAILGRDECARADIQPSGGGDLLVPEGAVWGSIEGLQPATFKPLWVEAGNLVQWKAPRKPVA